MLSLLSSRGKASGRRRRRTGRTPKREAAVALYPHMALPTKPSLPLASTLLPTGAGNDEGGEGEVDGGERRAVEATTTLPKEGPWRIF
jgi:hypothetical protein